MASKSLAFVIWAAVAASIVYWALELASVSRPVPLHAVVVGEAGAGGDLGRLFGRGVPAPAAGPAPVVQSTQIKLIGVVAPRAGGDSHGAVALISIEGKPPRSYRVGAPVEADLLLLSVNQRGAMLGSRDGNPTVRLELPPLAAPATSTLPVAGLLAPAARPAVLPAFRNLPPVGTLPPPVAVPPADQEPVEQDEPEPRDDLPERPGDPVERPNN